MAISMRAVVWVDLESFVLILQVHHLERDQQLLWQSLYRRCSDGRLAELWDDGKSPPRVGWYNQSTDGRL